MDDPGEEFGERRYDVEHAIQRGQIGNVEDVFANDVPCQEDDLGLLTGLRVAVPLGLALWAVLIWTIAHFVF